MDSSVKITITQEEHKAILREMANGNDFETLSTVLMRAVRSVGRYELEENGNMQLFQEARIPCVEALRQESREKFEKNHEVFRTPESLSEWLVSSAHDFFESYLEKKVEEKAVEDLLQQLSGYKAQFSSSKNKPSENSENSVDKEKETGEKGVRYLEQLVQFTNNLQKDLMDIVFGQDNAVSLFAQGYFQAEVFAKADKARVSPKATYLFAGPPGVGKTFLAENAAKLLNLPYMRFDMSEYSDKEANLEFCGSDKVYKGSKPGNVTSFVKENPRSILLFDEIEKAHINIIHLFLQILDAGRLRDNCTDEEVSFRDTIIIFTTNAGHQLYENSLTSNLSGYTRQSILDALKKDVDSSTKVPFFPAAICSRFASGNVVMFNHMESHNLISIAKREIEKKARIFEKEYGISIHLDERVFISLLLAEGGNCDARTMRSRAEAFFTGEMLELLRQLCVSPLNPTLSSIDKVEVSLDLSESSREVAELFENSTPIKVLFLSDRVSQMDLKHSDTYEVLVAKSTEDAIGILKKQDIALVVDDFRCNSSEKPFMSMEDVESDGRRLFQYLRESLEDMPVYILETDDCKLSFAEKLTFSRLGARGTISYSCSDSTDFMKSLEKISIQIHQHRNTMRLARANQVVSFETAQSVSEDGTAAMITLFDFKIVRSVEAEDSDKVVSGISKPDKCFADVIGAEDAKSELRYFVEYLKNPRKFVNMGVRQPKGVLLYGPPGTGKTLLAKAVAAESDATFISADGAQFLKQYVGQGAESIKALFRTARKYAPSIIFIDEIDAIGKNRTENRTGGTSNEDILNALLTEMDGFKANASKPVFVLAATNFAVEEGRGQRTLDPALVRRFDRKIFVELPSRAERETYIRRKNDADNALCLTENKIKNIAVRSTGMSLAEIENAIELSFRNAIRMNSVVVTDEIFEDAFESFNSGRVKNWDEKTLKRTARHEAGHALVCWHGGEMPSYLTIVARDNHGGYMQHGDQEGKGVYTRQEILQRIRTALGGRAAEMVYYGEEGYTSGASGDLQTATRLARLLLGSYGMDKDFGLAAIEPAEFTKEMRERVNQILERELAEAIKVIESHREKLDSLTGALLDKNHLTDQDMGKILGEK